MISKRTNLSSNPPSFIIFSIWIAIGAVHLITALPVLDTDPTAPTVPDPTNDPTNPGLQCALEGVYDLASATCNSPLYGPQDYQSIGLIIEDDQSGFGTCRVQVQLVSSACSEVEVWTVADREDGSADLWYDGVDSCLPENCTHFPMDDPCVLQDREWGGAYPIGFSVQGTTIEITGPLGYMLLCDGAMTTNWVRR